MPEWMIEGLNAEREAAEERMVRELEALDAMEVEKDDSP